MTLFDYDARRRTRSGPAGWSWWTGGAVADSGRVRPSRWGNDAIVWVAL